MGSGQDTPPAVGDKTVLEYASRAHGTAGAPPRPSADRVDAAAGCAVAAAAVLSAAGAVGLLAAAVARLGSPDADPFGPAFMFAGALVLVAVAVTCSRAVFRPNVRQGQVLPENT